ncbi:hypothetical protein [Mesorhizobium sp. M0520]|uniref:hypothetical protein n=1 Tax=unclassified Mesorhizobium TaxID=325217 RepID=UPI00333CDDBA
MSEIKRNFKGRPSSCFDWLVTPIASIERILADDGAQFWPRLSASMGQLLCDNNRAIYRHEFERTKSHPVIFTPEALQSCREKLIYKYNKMINIAIARKILFVYTTL